MINEDVETYKNLVDELLKEQPEEKQVELYMRKVGLDYTQDPLKRINQVLMALHTDQDLSQAEAKKK